MRKYAPFFLVASVAAGSLFAFSGGPIAVAEAVHAATTTVGPSFPRAERVTCDTTAGGIEIKPTGGYQLVSYECTAKGSVTVGGRTGAGGALTTSTGVDYVSGDRFGGNVQQPERCITTAGSTVLQCRFLVTTP